MSFDWSEYHQLARALADPGVILRATDTARQRAAVSRAYYAAFCMTRNYLRAKDGGSYSDSDAHRRVRTMLAQYGASAVRAADLLRKAQKERTCADYDDVYNASANLPNVLDWTQQVLALLKAMSEDS